MLYVTTRNKYDTYTVYRSNQSDRGPGGGLYLPFRLPSMDWEELLMLKEMPFCQRVAKILNLFFGAQLTAWDVELCGGKSPVSFVPMSHRILVVETWHNHDLDFAQFEKRLSARICGYEDAARKPTSWVGIAIRIAMLFAIYGELMINDVTRPDTVLDIALASGDFAAPMAVWYAREMGLPVGNIICSDGDSAVWNLLHQGQVRTDGGMPENVERLISATLGLEETLRYCEVCKDARLYTTRPGTLEGLRAGMYATVISADRQNGLIPSVYRMSGYIMGPQTAIAFGGLQDYRAKTGENRLALLMSDRSPICDSKTVASSMEISEQELREKLGE